MAADPLDGLAAAVAQARHALARIAEQRHAAERDFGAVVVNQAHLQHMLRAQRDHLEQTRVEIERTRDFAQRAGEQARSEGADDTPYLQTAIDLQRQADVVTAASRQLVEADAASSQNVARARELLRDNQARLDESLREQLPLLARLEQLDRERHIARYRG